MHEETSDELKSGNGQEFPFVVISVVTPFERDDTIVDFDNAAVGESDSVSIATEILDDTMSRFEGRLRVDNPFLTEASVDKIVKIAVVSEISLVVEEREIQILQEKEEFTSEFTGKNLNGNEKLFLGVEPLAGGRETTSRNDAVEMGVEREILPPSVENSGEAKLCAEIFFVGGEFLQGFGSSFEEQVIHESLILIENGTQLLGHSENDMEIADVKEILLLFLNPLFFSESLTLGTVTVTAGIVGNLGKAATAADVNVSAEFGGTAFGESIHDFELFVGQ